MKTQFLHAKQKSILIIIGMIFLIVYAQSQTVSNIEPITISVEKKNPSEISVLFSSQKHLQKKRNFGRRINRVQSNQLSLAGDQENEQENFAPENLTQCLRPPKSGSGFEGNPQTPFFLPPVGYYASESSIAISNAGKIVSISNGWIRYYDEKGKILFSDSLYHFCLGLIDVRVQYDPKRDHFVFLAGYGVTDFDNTFIWNGVVLAFSKSNNPLDGWNFYYFSDSLIGDNATGDYPQLGMSDDEVFFTDLRVDENGNVVNSDIVQVDKNAGYSGKASIHSKVYSVSLSGNYGASIVPATGGSTTYGPNMYFVMADETGSSDDLYYVFEVTNTISSRKAVLKTFGPVHSGESYSPAPLSFQPGHIPLLEQGTEGGGLGFDDFLQNAFFENGILQFSQNSAANGKGSVCVGRISGIPTHLSCNAQTISDPRLTLLFPQIVYTGNSHNDNSAMVGIEYTGEKKYPGLQAVSIDNYFSISQPTTVKEGEDTIDGLWGDYSALCRRYNHPGECWMEGQYGSNVFKNINWIAQLHAISCNQFGEQKKLDNEFASTLSVAPNPFSQSTIISFSISQSEKVSVTIYDMNGRLIKTLAGAQMLAGAHQLTWNARDEKGNTLNTGIYFLRIETENYSETKKLVIAR